MAILNRSAVSLVVGTIFSLVLTSCFNKSDNKAPGSNDKNDVFSGSSGEIYSGKKTPLEPVATLEDYKGMPRLEPGFYKERFTSFAYSADNKNIDVRSDYVRETISALGDNYRTCLNTTNEEPEKKKDTCINDSFNKCRIQARKKLKNTAEDQIAHCRIAVTELENETFPPSAVTHKERLDIYNEKISEFTKGMRSSYQVCLKAKSDTDKMKKDRCLKATRDKCEKLYTDNAREPASDSLQAHCKVAVLNLECEKFPDSKGCKGNGSDQENSPN